MVVSAFCLLSISVQAGQNNIGQVVYIEGIDDVPLMQGLEPDVNGSFIYDKAEGRIVEFQAYGVITPKEVLAFYSKTLPELGWIKLDSSVYERGDERLKITFLQKNKVNKTAVHFNLAPKHLD